MYLILLRKLKAERERGANEDPGLGFLREREEEEVVMVKKKIQGMLKTQHLSFISISTHI